MIFSTAGFDVSVQLRQDFLREVLAAAYFTGVLPDFSAGSISAPLVGDFDYEIYLGAPSLFIMGDTATPTIEYVGTFTARISTLDHEIVGDIRFPVPITVMTMQDDGQTIQALRLDLREITVDAVQVTLTPPSPIFQAIARDRLVTLLRALQLQVPLSPSMDGGTFIAMQTFADPSQDSFPISEIHEQNYISLFINLDGRVAPTPTAHPAHLWRANPTKKRNFDSATAVPEAQFMPALRQALVDAGNQQGQLLPGTTDNMNINVVVGTLKKLVLSQPIDLQLLTGALRVLFHITLVIDGFADVIAKVDAKLGISIGGNKLFTDLLNPDDFFDVDIDVPLIGQILLGLISAGLIPLFEQLLEEALVLGVTSAAQDAAVPTVPLPEQTVFLGGIAITTGDAPENAPAVVVRNHELEMYPQGIILRSWIDLSYTRVPRQRPSYLRAHKKTLQFHQPGCRYGDSIRDKNLRLFIRPDLALAAGFDGCKICLPQFDGNSPGSLKLFFQRLGLPAEQEHHEKVLWTCTYVGGNKTSGTAQTQTIENESTQKTSTKGSYLSSVALSNLRPGVWEVAVTNGVWSTKHNIQVFGDQQNRYQFTLGVKKPQKV